MVGHACHPSTWEGEAKGLRASGHSEPRSETLSQAGEQNSAWLAGQFKDAIKDPNSVHISVPPNLQYRPPCSFSGFTVTGQLLPFYGDHPSSSMEEEV